MQIVDFGYYAADTVIGLVLFGVLFLLSIVQLVDSLQALLLFSSELLIESRRGAQVRLFDQKFGAGGWQWTPAQWPAALQASSNPGKSCACSCCSAEHIIRRRCSSSASGPEPLAQHACCQLWYGRCSADNHRLSSTADTQEQHLAASHQWWRCRRATSAPPVNIQASSVSFRWKFGHAVCKNIRWAEKKVKL